MASCSETEWETPKAAATNWRHRSSSIVRQRCAGTAARGLNLELLNEFSLLETLKPFKRHQANCWQQERRWSSLSVTSKTDAASRFVRVGMACNSRNSTPGVLAWSTKIIGRLIISLPQRLAFKL